jgi:DNA-binding transcriptional MerR regulator
MTARTRTDKPFPPIPSKRYFTIGEVGQLCDVKSHVLRYWEQEFTQLRPIKRRGNRRYYQRHDIELIRLIRTLLYEQGFTIAGARQQLAALPKATSRESTSALEAIRDMRERISQSGGNLLALEPQPDSGAATETGAVENTAAVDIRQIREGLEALASELSPYCGERRADS